MQLNRDHAFLLLVGAAMVVGTSVTTVIRKWDILHDGLGTDFVFLGTNWLLAATLGWIGCRRLRELKRACPDQSLQRFLRPQLIMTVVMVTLTAGVTAMPEAWRKAAWDFFHEVELLRMVARGGR